MTVGLWNHMGLRDKTQPQPTTTIITTSSLSLIRSVPSPYSSDSLVASPIFASSPPKSMAVIQDIPDVLISNIISAVSDTRARNSISLVCRKFLLLERSTRLSLTLRGNARDLFLVPTCFRAVTWLNLSLLSPWGYSFLSSSSPLLLAHRLSAAFPSVISLTLYARSPETIHFMLSQWPGLQHLKLVRWHQRLPHWPLGADFTAFLQQCPNLTSLDLTSFYYWKEDLPHALQVFPATSTSLLHLNLLTSSIAEGFKSQEIQDITVACPNLSTFMIVCTFDPRYMGSVDDETLLAISSNCPKLKHLELVDSSFLNPVRGDPEMQGFESVDVRLTTGAFVDFFTALPLLEKLVLEVGKNVMNSGYILEKLNSKCKELKVLKLGHFHGVCMAIDSPLDGIALCSGLHELSIVNCGDLTDMGLIAIGRGCGKLAKFEIEGCKAITYKGMRTLASLLKRSLVHVKISCCKNLDATASLRSLEPICDRILWLHIDCVWDGLEQFENFDNSGGIDLDCGDTRMKKKFKHASASSSYMEDDGSGYSCKTWEKLQCLSLWIGVGELLTPLPLAGLEVCPNLEEISIKVEGDCRGRRKPSKPKFGLATLFGYPNLAKMLLDCSETTGYALTAPSGQMDLSLWERFFLNGIRTLSLTELDYWPPQDKDVSQRSISLPAAGLLAECKSLRKLFIHGTAHEHFMNFLLQIENLRDVQLREDYYPAPEDDMSTEMRFESCCRFEDTLNNRSWFPD